MAATGSKRRLCLSRKRKSKEPADIFSKTEEFSDFRSREKRINLQEKVSLDQQVKYMPSGESNAYSSDVLNPSPPDVFCSTTDSRVNNTVSLPSLPSPIHTVASEKMEYSDSIDYKNSSSVTCLSCSNIILTPTRPEYVTASVSTAQVVLKETTLDRNGRRNTANVSSQTTLDSFFGTAFQRPTSIDSANTPKSDSLIPKPPTTPIISQSLCMLGSGGSNMLQDSREEQKHLALSFHSKTRTLVSEPLSRSISTVSMSKCFSDAYIGKSSFSKRTCPTYKWIPGTGFTVDAFCYATIPNCLGYFLSHFHSDHYMGLTRHFKHTLYCSEVTSNLVCQQLKVSPQCIHHLPMNEPVLINGVTVILLEANHCPGSVMFLFRLRNGKVFLHTGDFRATPSMKQSDVLKNLSVDTLYLDTTYCSPQYDFPPQDLVIQFVVGTTLHYLAKHPKAMVVCGTYTIGKEKIFQAIAEVLNCKVYMSKEKKKIMDCLESQDLSEMCVCNDPSSTRLHIVSINKMSPQELLSYLSMFSGHFSSLLAFKPTGWTFSNNSISLKDIKPRKYSQVTLYDVPYSEHSSFSELRDFVKFFKPNCVVSTVGGYRARKNAESKSYQWLNEKNETKKTKQITLDAIYKR